MTRYVQALAVLVLLTPRGAAQEFRPEPVHVEVLPPPRPAEEQAEALGDDDRRFLGRLRPHIRQQVLEEMAAALDDKVEGVGGVFAMKLVEFVKKAVRKVVELIILGVLVNLFWAYFGHVITVALGVPALVAWIVSKRSKS